MTAAPLPAWVDDAICASTDPESWFPEQGANANAAIRLCQRCPVKEPCLEYALSFERQGGVAYGIYGGMTPSARTRVLRSAERQCRTEGCNAVIPRATWAPYYCEPCRNERHRVQQAAYNARRGPR